MRIETYRGAPFVDREEEIEFLVDWFNEVPQRILWVYGPKSSGKTTLISYVIEKKLLPQEKWLSQKSKYLVKYLNLREKFITSYRTFLEAFVVPEDVYEEEVKTEASFGIKFFRAKRERIERVRKRELDWGEIFLEEILSAKKEKKRAVIVVDEIQELQEVYIKNGNGERELLREFLTFCVSLTKEKHLSHVVILTSNTVFVERIYNDAKLKATSRFKKIDHLSKDKVFEWLELENFKRAEIELVWEYYGGAISYLLEAIRVKKKRVDLKEFLKREAWLAYTEIDEYLAKFKENEIKFFKDVAGEIVKKGYFSIERLKEEKRSFLQKWAEKEILFYDPLELKVYANSRIYEKGMEILLKRN